MARFVKEHRRLPTNSEYRGFIQGETVKAILFISHYWTVAQWLPKSVIILLPQEEGCDERVVQLPPWLAKRVDANNAEENK